VRRPFDARPNDNVKGPADRLRSSSHIGDGSQRPPNGARSPRGSEMLVENLSFSVLTGAVNQNAMANSRYATLSRPAMVRYYAVQEDATLASDALVEITHGNVIVRTNSAIPQAAAAGVGPNLNEHLIAEAAADVNDRIVIRAENTGAATAIFRIIVHITLL